MKGRPAYRKRLTPEHPFVPDDAECCAWRNAEGRVCGLPHNNRHHTTYQLAQSPLIEPEQMRLDIDG